MPVEPDMPEAPDMPDEPTTAGDTRCVERNADIQPSDCSSETDERVLMEMIVFLDRPPADRA